MAETGPTKVCRLCAETIRAEAKVCPYCRRSQRGMFFLSRFDLIGVVAGLLLLVTFVILTEMLSQGRDFASSRDKIAVVCSELSVKTNRDGEHLVVVGVLTNQSPYAWRIGRFEVRFLDRAGKVIDADRDWDDFTVLPGASHAFKLTFYSRKTIPESARYQVSIRSAHDPRYNEY